MPMTSYLLDFETALCTDWFRVFIPFPAIELSSVSLRRSPSNLLEEEWNAGCNTLISNRSSPVNIQRPIADATFATDDHPVYGG